MARKKKHEEHGNHEAWAIPYGDLVTLLLAFFVVMYAMSSVNEGKYRILSDSLTAAFRGPPKSLQPVQVGQQSKSRQPMQLNRTRTLVPMEMDDPAPDADELEATEKRKAMLGAEYMRGSDLKAEDLDDASRLIEKLTEAIAEQLSELVDQNLVRIRRERFWLEIEINTSVLFDSASAELSAESLPVLQRISETLAGTHTKIQVEGHTDSRPIHTAAFATNWELSAARAATLVRLFVKHGVAPEHLAAVGFGEYRGIAANDTPEGRQKNRRVVIVVMAREVQTGRELWTAGKAEADGVDNNAPQAPQSAGTPLAQASAP